MLDRIEQLVLRPKTIQSTEVLKMRGMGRHIFDNREPLYHADIKKATGFEAPQADVQGGRLYSGGSSFKGIRINDRQLVITIVPNRDYTPTQIKHILNQMMGMSMIEPLELQITYKHAGGRETWKTDVYLTDITSPIFEKSRDVQITLMMGDVSFTTTTRGMTGDGDTDQDTFEHNMLGYSPTSLRSRFSRFKPSDYSLERANAPSNYTVSFTYQVNDVDLTRIKYFYVSNLVGDAILIRPTSDFPAWYRAHVDVNYALEFQVDSFKRKIYRKSATGVAKPLDGPFSVETIGRWVQLYPAPSALEVGAASSVVLNYQVVTPTYITYDLARYGF